MQHFKLMKLKVPELKALLKQKGLPTSGVKSVLIHRLLSNGSKAVVVKSATVVPIQLPKLSLPHYQQTTSDLVEVVPEFEQHYYENDPWMAEALVPKTIKRIFKDLDNLRDVVSSLTDARVKIFVSEEALLLWKFIIVPPSDTGYYGGMFEFHMILPPDYPNRPPKVILTTTGDGAIRFNPNLYSDGKVCLSLLGTWGGQSESEKWIPPSASNPGSTFSQLMLSIYSMIFTEFPWYNEPGRERGISDAEKCPRSIEYNKELQIGTIKYAIMNQLKYPEEGFENVIKTHFKLKQDEVIEYMKKQSMSETTITQFKDLVNK